ncbi:MAG TPA: peptidase, partial [Hyphomonas sp.]|nr:peptidase [Hyphomonas sp.]
PITGVDTALINLDRDIPEANPFIVIVHEPGTKSQHIEIYGDETNRLIYGETYTYSTDGKLLATGHNSDGPVGQQVAMSMYRLHFGDFGGALMKSIYFLLGIMLCIVVATGLNIYFLKRREKGRAAPRLEPMWSGWIWGSMAMFPITLTVSLLGVSGGWLIAMFWLGSIVFSGVATVWMS